MSNRIFNRRTPGAIVLLPTSLPTDAYGPIDQPSFTRASRCRPKQPVILVRLTKSELDRILAAQKAGYDVHSAFETRILLATEIPELPDALDPTRSTSSRHKRIPLSPRAKARIASLAEQKGMPRNHVYLSFLYADPNLNLSQPS